MQAALASDATVAAPAVKPEPRTPKLHPRSFFDAATRRNVWSVELTLDTPYEALFRPDYWANVARKIRPGDLIEVTAEDGSYFAQLYVLAQAEQSVAVAELSKVDLQNVELSDGSEDFKVQWAGPVLKYAVVRVKDNVRVSEKHATRAEASAALTSYLRTLSR